MSVLTTLGAASMVFVAAFTWHNYRKDAGAGQTPRWSIVETWIHLVAGFILNLGVNQLMIPLMTGGAGLTLEANWWGGWVYTAVSLVRTYTIRRASNALQFVRRTT